MARLREIRPRIRALPVSRIKPIDLPAELIGDGTRAERTRLYASDRWIRLRRRMLAGSCARCFFCDEPIAAEVLEHMVGHGADAQAVAAALGLPSVSPDWRERFWTGPFAGSCQMHARQRSGHEAAGRLLKWTEDFVARRRGIGL